MIAGLARAWCLMKINLNLLYAAFFGAAAVRALARRDAASLYLLPPALAYAAYVVSMGDRCRWITSSASGFPYCPYSTCCGEGNGFRPGCGPLQIRRFARPSLPWS